MATKRKTEPHLPAGRHTAYKPEYDEQVYKLALLGLTDEELAKFFEVSHTTIYNWDKAFPSFLASRARGRDIADGEVVVKFRERALGYSHKAEKIMINRSGEIIRAEYTEHYPPDTQAASLWLANRQPSRWRLRPGETDADRDAGITIRIEGGLPEPEGK